MKEVEVKVIVTGSVRGEAIVSKKPISFLGGVDGKKGIIADIQSELHGKSIKDKIFVFPESVGSTVGSYVIYSLKVNNVSPLALVTNHAETIVIAGAILAEIPFFEVENRDITKIVSTGDIISIDPERRTLTIDKKSNS
ncbi:MAG: DUF126 domain-containing protein [Candidatus Heimdallarchaeum aukensis]|uniref:phosphomevalonate dehydratase n=1 Tax=Candidatus Heimdallarchaeum aukensis TaxID=2876573 RepID=A0A9Y1BJI7_9ARCH|nr:MAG: DUF126 domain-containing protein [Candidatus Heimdallarchaeum aukensis]